MRIVEKVVWIELEKVGVVAAVAAVAAERVPHLLLLARDPIEVRHVRQDGAELPAFANVDRWSEGEAALKADRVEEGKGQWRRGGVCP